MYKFKINCKIRIPQINKEGIIKEQTIGCCTGKKMYGIFIEAIHKRKELYYYYEEDLLFLEKKSIKELYNELKKPYK